MNCKAVGIGLLLASFQVYAQQPIAGAPSRVLKSSPSLVKVAHAKSHKQAKANGNSGRAKQTTAVALVQVPPVPTEDCLQTVQSVGASCF